MSRSASNRKPDTPTSRGRPRRSVEREAELRAKAIAAARELFAAEGFEAVSMRRIAQATGCGVMTLYGYFQSRNEILRHIWDDFFAELFVQVEAAMSRGTPRARLRRACSVYVEYWCKHPDRYRMVFLNQDQRATDEALYVESSTIIERFEGFRELIIAMQIDGSGRPGRPQQLAEALLCALIGMTHALVTIPEYAWQPRAKLLRACLAIVEAEPA